MAKYGEQAFSKAFMRGAKEIAQALPALPDSVKVVEEPGLSPKAPEPVDERNDRQKELDDFDKKDRYATLALRMNASERGEYQPEMER